MLILGSGPATHQPQRHEASRNLLSRHCDLRVGVLTTIAVWSTRNLNHGFAVKPSTAKNPLQGSTPLAPLPVLPRKLRLLVVIAAVSGVLAGAGLAMLPALVLGMVTMFYNGTGGILIFLGSLIPAMPHFADVGQGRSALPVFQQLESSPTTVILRSLAVTTLCAVAVALIMATYRRRSDGRFWLMAGLCCLLAAVAGGRLVAFCLIPAILASIGHVIHHRVHHAAN